MKKIFLTLMLLFSVAFGQTALNYFPPQLGHTWIYEVSTLDSQNEPIEELTYFRKDSLAANDIFYENDCFLILSKSGQMETLPNQNYLDSNFVKIEENISSIFIGALFDELPEEVFGELPNYAGWYDAYNFNSGFNNTIEIFRLDTTVVINSNELNLRFTLESTRLNDEEIETEIGNFTAAKFKFSLNVYMISVVPIKLFELPSYQWLAEDNWIVKEYREYAEFAASGSPTIEFPGYLKEVKSSINDVEEYSDQIANNFILEQNFPNPFNPTTVISYALPQASNVNVVIYNALGQIVETLVNQEQAAGIYKFNWNAANQASGIYFVKIVAQGTLGENFTDVKKMMLIK